MKSILTQKLSYTSISPGTSLRYKCVRVGMLVRVKRSAAR